MAKGNGSPEPEDADGGTPIGAGDGEELFCALFDVFDSDCVLALPLRLRLRYAAIAPASFSRTRLAIGESTDAGFWGVTRELMDDAELGGNAAVNEVPVDEGIGGRREVDTKGEEDP